MGRVLWTIIHCLLVAVYVLLALAAVPIITLLLLPHVSRGQEQHPITARVTQVVDGDTIKIEITLRLEAVDCPEKTQEQGQAAITRMQQLVNNKRLRVIITKRDFFGRFLGTVTDEDGNDISAILVREGLCWVYKTSKDPVLVTLQERARAKKLGIWAGRPIAPWEWRRRKRGVQ